jgi:hypothetical protein
VIGTRKAMYEKLGMESDSENIHKIVGKSLLYCHVSW